ncbi:MAG TPA: hypothetical protein VGQ28_11440 [Thermoanaerobaculia bacterium]|jgi:hypothetical protein|nr:hypothetical protein [Thermoanaerobaculia bacterium]
MKKLTEDVSRRDFGKLALAAFGGVVAGSMLGSSLLSADEKKAAPKDAHSCCGLNGCKGQGAGGKNDCAGQGSCATVEAHSCAGSNGCKGQGGTGDNACKGKGSCAVPSKGESWKKARASYEARMTKAKKKYGAAPSTCGAA